MKTGVEALKGIRYKLRMMGTLDRSNLCVWLQHVCHTSQPELTLKKKSNSICYHAVCEAVASGKLLTTHCKTGDNHSDMMTKVLYGQKKRDSVSCILYDIYNHDDGPNPATE